MKIVGEQIHFSLLPPLVSEGDLVCKALDTALPDDELTIAVARLQRERDISVFHQVFNSSPFEERGPIFLPHESFPINRDQVPKVIAALAYFTSEEVFLEELALIDEMTPPKELDEIRKDFIDEQERSFQMMRELQAIGKAAD